MNKRKEGNGIHPLATARARALAVQRLNSFGKGRKGVGMGEGDIAEGWKISQVERLIDLPRRDIQRACYAGKGGAAILSPANSTWGRRLYSIDDLARLLLVKLYKNQGYSLPEIKEVLGEKTDGTETQRLLAVQAARLQEQLEETQLQLNRTQLLAKALSADEEGVLSELRARIRREVAQGVLGQANDNGTTSDSENAPLTTLEHLLDAPGIDLAIDLWAGPGAYDAVVEKLPDLSRQTE